MTSRFGVKSAAIAERYGVVENQDRRFAMEPIRSDETKRRSPSAGSDSLPLARAATAALYWLHAVTNFPVSTTYTNVRSINAAASGGALRLRSQIIARSRSGNDRASRPSP